MNALSLINVFSFGGGGDKLSLFLGFSRRFERDSFTFPLTSLLSSKDSDDYSIVKSDVKIDSVSKESYGISSSLIVFHLLTDFLKEF